jgi:hypothetical protein
MDHVYHIYAKDKCVYHNLTEEEFKQTWPMILSMADLLGYESKKDLSYECLTRDKEYLNSSY